MVQESKLPQSNEANKHEQCILITLLAFKMENIVLTPTNFTLMVFVMNAIKQPGAELINRSVVRYVSHVLPESKSVAILVVNERPPCTPISVF